jgi:NADPH:quinone reductase-like Zn-dependent oxidoreductase
MVTVILILTLVRIVTTISSRSLQCSDIAFSSSEPAGLFPPVFLFRRLVLNKPLTAAATRGIAAPSRRAYWAADDPHQDRPTMATIRALQLLADRQVAVTERPPPPPPAPQEAQIRVKVVGLNHIDVWGYRGMAFAKRQYPLTVAAEAAGEVIAVGAEVSNLQPGDRVIPFGALTCGVCPACLKGRDNLCENVAGVRGFHVDGFAQDITNHPARLLVKIPDGVSDQDAACVTVAYGTVEHMLFDNAKLEPGEWILVQAGGSGIGSIAIRIAKSIGCTVITTVGSADKAAKAVALGADHVINYREDRFEGVTRKLTKKKGVDVVFEHTGADTWAGSLLSMKRGGRLVTCGATSGPIGSLNLMQLFQQQYRIIGSFGAPISALERALGRIASGVKPVIDTVYGLDDFQAGVERLEHRDVFGKILISL